MTNAARSPIDAHPRAHPIIGDGYLFPSASDSAEPYGPTAFNKWLRGAEHLAGLEPLAAGLWPPYRRKFATEMAHVSDRLVARLGGWRTPRTLDLYSQPRDELLSIALEERRELREAK